MKKDLQGTDNERWDQVMLTSNEFTKVLSTRKDEINKYLLATEKADVLTSALLENRQFRNEIWNMDQDQIKLLAKLTIQKMFDVLQEDNYDWMSEYPDKESDEYLMEIQ